MFFLFLQLLRKFCSGLFFSYLNFTFLIYTEFLLSFACSSLLLRSTLHFLSVTSHDVISYGDFVNGPRSRFSHKSTSISLLVFFFLLNFLLSRGGNCSFGGGKRYSVEGWGLVLSFIVTLSESSYLIVESDSFVTFDFFLSAAFDQKFVILDFFVNDKFFLRLLASSILPQVHWL